MIMDMELETTSINSSSGFETTILGKLDDQDPFGLLTCEIKTAQGTTGKTIFVKKNVEIGRGTQCDIRLTDVRLSQVQCTISFDNFHNTNTPILKSVSKNILTRVNGKDVRHNETISLEDGFVLSVSRSRLVWNSFGSEYRNMWEKAKAIQSSKILDRSDRNVNSQLEEQKPEDKSNSYNLQNHGASTSSRGRVKSSGNSRRSKRRKSSTDIRVSVLRRNFQKNLQDNSIALCHESSISESVEENAKSRGSPPENSSPSSTPSKGSPRRSKISMDKMPVQTDVVENGKGSRSLSLDSKDLKASNFLLKRSKSLNAPMVSNESLEASSSPHEGQENKSFEEMVVSGSQKSVNNSESINKSRDRISKSNSETFEDENLLGRNDISSLKPNDAGNDVGTLDISRKARSLLGHLDGNAAVNISSNLIEFSPITSEDSFNFSSKVKCNQANITEEKLPRDSNNLDKRSSSLTREELLQYVNEVIENENSDGDDNDNDTPSPVSPESIYSGALNEDFDASLNSTSEANQCTDEEIVSRTVDPDEGSIIENGSQMIKNESDIVDRVKNEDEETDDVESNLRTTQTLSPGFMGVEKIKSDEVVEKLDPQGRKAQQKRDSIRIEEMFSKDPTDFLDIVLNPISRTQNRVESKNKDLASSPSPQEFSETDPNKEGMSTESVSQQRKSPESEATVIALPAIESASEFHESHVSGNPFSFFDEDVPDPSLPLLNTPESDSRTGFTNSKGKGDEQHASRCDDSDDVLNLSTNDNMEKSQSRSNILVPSTIHSESEKELSDYTESSQMKAQVSSYASNDPIDVTESFSNDSQLSSYTNQTALCETPSHVASSSRPTRASAKKISHSCDSPSKRNSSAGRSILEKRKTSALSVSLDVTAECESERKDEQEHIKLSDRIIATPKRRGRNVSRTPAKTSTPLLRESEPSCMDSSSLIETIQDVASGKIGAEYLENCRASLIKTPGPPSNSSKILDIASVNAFNKSDILIPETPQEIFKDSRNSRSKVHGTRSSSRFLKLNEASASRKISDVNSSSTSECLHQVKNFAVNSPSPGEDIEDLENNRAVLELTENAEPGSIEITMNVAIENSHDHARSLEKEAGTSLLVSHISGSEHSGRSGTAHLRKSGKSLPRNSSTEGRISGGVCGRNSEKWSPELERSIPKASADDTIENAAQGEDESNGLEERDILVHQSPSVEKTTDDNVFDRSNRYKSRDRFSKTFESDVSILNTPFSDSMREDNTNIDTNTKISKKNSERNELSVTRTTAAQEVSFLEKDDSTLIRSPSIEHIIGKSSGSTKTNRDNGQNVTDEATREKNLEKNENYLTKSPSVKDILTASVSINKGISSTPTTGAAQVIASSAQGKTGTNSLEQNDSSVPQSPSLEEEDILDDWVCSRVARSPKESFLLKTSEDLIDAVAKGKIGEEFLKQAENSLKNKSVRIHEPISSSTHTAQGSYSEPLTPSRSGRRRSGRKRKLGTNTPSLLDNGSPLNVNSSSMQLQEGQPSESNCQSPGSVTGSSKERAQTPRSTKRKLRPRNFLKSNSTDETTENDLALDPISPLKDGPLTVYDISKMSSLLCTVECFDDEEPDDDVFELYSSFSDPPLGQQEQTSLIAEVQASQRSPVPSSSKLNPPAPESQQTDLVSTRQATKENSNAQLTTNQPIMNDAVEKGKKFSDEANKPSSSLSSAKINLRLGNRSSPEISHENKEMESNDLSEKSNTSSFCVENQQKESRQDHKFRDMELENLMEQTNTDDADTGEEIESNLPSVASMMGELDLVDAQEQELVESHSRNSQSSKPTRKRPRRQKGKKTLKNSPAPNPSTHPTISECIESSESNCSQSSHSSAVATSTPAHQTQEVEVEPVEFSSKEDAITTATKQRSRRQLRNRGKLDAETKETPGNSLPTEDVGSTSQIKLERPKRGRRKPKENEKNKATEQNIDVSTPQKIPEVSQRAVQNTSNLTIQNDSTCSYISDSSIVRLTRGRLKKAQAVMLPPNSVNITSEAETPEIQSVVKPRRGARKKKNEQEEVLAVEFKRITRSASKSAAPSEEPRTVVDNETATPMAKGNRRGGRRRKGEEDGGDAQTGKDENKGKVVTTAAATPATQTLEDPSESSENSENVATSTNEKKTQGRKRKIANQNVEVEKKEAQGTSSTGNISIAERVKTRQAQAKLVKEEPIVTKRSLRPRK